MSKIANPMKVITGPDTRWSYANVWEPKSIYGGAPKYSVSLIIPKSDNKILAKIKAAIEAAYKEGEAKLKGNGKSVPALSAIKTPLRDGDTERPDDPAYANAYFINANAISAPGIPEPGKLALLHDLGRDDGTAALPRRRWRCAGIGKAETDRGKRNTPSTLFPAEPCGKWSPLPRCTAGWYACRRTRPKVRIRFVSRKHFAANDFHIIQIEGIQNRYLFTASFPGFP